MYSKLSKYYQKLGFGEFAGVFFKEALPLIKSFRQTHDIKISDLKVVDLACGTGELCHLLHREGYSVSGLDISREMLVHARRKNLGLKFYHKDLRKFSLRPKFHIATCSFDSLNHIMEASELMVAFKNVHHCLGKSGIFVFDMNTPSGLEGWRHSVNKSDKDFFMHRRSRERSSKWILKSYEVRSRPSRGGSWLLRRNVRSRSN